MSTQANSNSKTTKTASKSTKKEAAPKPVDQALPNGLGTIRDILLGEYISSWETRISKMEKGVKELISKTESKLVELDSKMSALDKELRDELETNLLDLEQENGDLRSLVEKFKEDLSSKINSVEGNKMDRDSIADFFSQIGQRVRGD